MGYHVLCQTPGTVYGSYGPICEDHIHLVFVHTQFYVISKDLHLWLLFMN